MPVAHVSLVGVVGNSLLQQTAQVNSLANYQQSSLGKLLGNGFYFPVDSLGQALGQFDGARNLKA
jgi:hypothetical protein